MMDAESLTAPPASVRLHVGQGEHLITGDPQVMLTTILGSCVAMCLRDPVARIGGMNHFLLPSGRTDGADEGRRYGAYAMEVLINGVLTAGGRRDRLEAKLFGGGRMFDGLADVGVANANFAEKFLADEGIPIIASSLRGHGARRVQFWPATGRALQKSVSDRPVERRVPPPVVADSGELELF